MKAASCLPWGLSEVILSWKVVICFDAFSMKTWSAVIYLQCPDHFPLLVCHLATWRRFVSHIDILSIRSANCKLEESLPLHQEMDQLGLIMTALRYMPVTWSLPWEGWKQLWTVTLVHAVGAVALQMLKRVTLGKQRKWKCVLILLHCVWSLWPRGPRVLLTVCCWHSSTLRS